MRASRRHGAKDLNVARAPVHGPRGSSNDGQEQAMIVLEDPVKNRGRGLHNRRVFLSQGW
jgi:hypothetical protein